MSEWTPELPWQRIPPVEEWMFSSLSTFFVVVVAARLGCIHCFVKLLYWRHIPVSLIGPRYSVVRFVNKLMKLVLKCCVTVWKCVHISVFVYVCMGEWERERLCVCVCESEGERKRARKTKVSRDINDSSAIKQLKIS